MGMGEDAPPLFDTSGMQEMLFEDIRDLSIRGSIFRCTLYTYKWVSGFKEPCWVPVQPLAMPIAAVPMVCGKALELCGAEAIRSAREFVRDKVSLLH